MSRALVFSSLLRECLSPCRRVLVALLLIACACARAAAQPSLRAGGSGAAFDRKLALASFDSAWSHVRRTYYDTTFHGLDWTAIGREARAQTERSVSAVEARGVLEAVLGQLGESHFAILPRELAHQWESAPSPNPEATTGDTGLEFRLLTSGDVVVAGVRGGSPAEQAGVRAGWTLEMVGSFDVVSFAQKGRGELTRSASRMATLRIPLAIRGRTAGAAGSEVALVFRDELGRRVRRRIMREESRGEVVRFGHLPPQLVQFEWQQLGDRNGCIGVIRFNIWMTIVMSPLDDAMVALRDCRGLVIDLRGNVGGVAAMVMGVGGYMVDSAASLGAMTTRGTTLRYVINPRRTDRHGGALRPFAGPIAVLVDGVSASTSEIFAAGLQGVGRARIFGEPTAGQALPAVLTRLPNGDVLQHVVADFRDPTGQRIEGRGVAPDEFVPLTRETLLAGRDAALEAALRWISGSSRVSPVSAGHP